MGIESKEGGPNQTLNKSITGLTYPQREKLQIEQIFNTHDQKLRSRQGHHHFGTAFGVVTKTNLPPTTFDQGLSNK